ncbi:MAG: fused response regulator/phosphatase [Candidatus Riflebacteria bacterium]
MATNKLANFDETMISAPLILVVDDDFCSNLTLQTILSHEGFRAITATDSISCFAAIKDNLPELILLDVEFPDESGFDICRKIHENPSTTNVPVLFISANDDVTSKVKGFEAGGVDYITKPWQKEEILARVRTHLRLQQALLFRSELQSMKLEKLKQAQDASLVKSHESPEARFSVFFKPLQELGGDFYDVIKLGDQIFDYIIADISGHDISIALISSALKMLLRQNSSILSTPRDTLLDINKAIPAVIQPDQFVALTIVRLNRKAGKAWIVNSGNPSPVYFSSQNKNHAILNITGDLVGIFQDVSFQLYEMKIAAGDRFYIYSDGILDLFAEAGKSLKEKTSVAADFLAKSCDGEPATFPTNLSDQAKKLVKPGDDMVAMCIEV